MKHTRWVDHQKALPFSSPTDTLQAPTQESRIRVRPKQYSKLPCYILEQGYGACDTPVKATKGCERFFEGRYACLGRKAGHGRHWRCRLWDRFQAVGRRSDRVQHVSFRVTTWKSATLADSLVSKYINAFGANPINELRYMAAFLLPNWLFELLPLPTKLREAVAFIRAKCAECVDAARQAMQSEKKPSLHFNTICDVALASNAFSDRNLEYQLMTILAAGHHTSACSLTATVALLCQHQAVQARLRAEIAPLLSPSASETDDVVAKIVQLPYLQAVCRESLRLFPPVPKLQRLTTLPTTLLGYSIPKHTLLVVSPWVVHRDPMHWGPDASEFRPARWLDGGAAGGGSIGKNSFLPFSHGPRNCIGQVFAGAELAITVAVLVSRFHLELGQKAPIWEEEVLLKPKGGVVEVVLTPVL